MKEAKKCGHRYKWAEFFSKEEFCLLRGKDFICRLDSMALMVRQRAPKYGVTVSVAIDELTGSIHVFVKRKEESSAKNKKRKAGKLPPGLFGRRSR